MCWDEGAKYSPGADDRRTFIPLIESCGKKYLLCWCRRSTSVGMQEPNTAWASFGALYTDSRLTCGNKCSVGVTRIS